MSSIARRRLGPRRRLGFHRPYNRCNCSLSERGRAAEWRQPLRHFGLGEMRENLREAGDEDCIDGRVFGNSKLLGIAECTGKGDGG